MRSEGWTPRETATRRGLRPWPVSGSVPPDVAENQQAMPRDTITILRVLLVEDNPGDAVLVREALLDAPGPTFALDWQPTLTAGLTALDI